MTSETVDESPPGAGGWVVLVGAFVVVGFLVGRLVAVRAGRADVLRLAVGVGFAVGVDVDVGFAVDGLGDGLEADVAGARQSQ